MYKRTCLLVYVYHTCLCLAPLPYLGTISFHVPGVPKKYAGLIDNNYLVHNSCRSIKLQQRYSSRIAKLDFDIIYYSCNLLQNQHKDINVQSQLHVCGHVQNMQKRHTKY